MTVITRFAPSPTGYLHIGSARTALFNYLFAKHHGGQFLLRIEDTDRARSTQEAVNAIVDSMKWLGLDWDGETVYQFARAERHAAIARQLLAEGKAYYCYCSPEELEQMREHAKANNLPPRYNGFWRDRDPSEAPAGVAPVIRFKAPQEGETIIEDLVQGTVCIQNSQLDDMVLLRADGTPTYMLSVVVDDHDMNVTHIIRGDDHLTNAFRQHHLYQSCQWDVPQFAHLPLIHGPDGAKLSKRHGALGAESYRDLGFLPEAMCNYLLRLGWSHGDEEIISRDQAIAWFDTDSIGRSPARFDMAKLTNLNAHYIREADNARLMELCQPVIEEKLGLKLSVAEFERITLGMTGLKQRAKTIMELADNALIYVRLATPDEKAQKFITDAAKTLVKEVIQDLGQADSFTEHELDAKIRETAERLGEKLGTIAQPLRVALTGSTVSPSVFEVMAVLGKQESLQRLAAFVGEAN
ncbi:glutamate--tRNA ligase [Candidatus Odyssella acanthamoebae]|uniref:Glutamate--tRNA ligase n=1 Tax=Candidatus Odyssella acanthamoebae TaxID=91604 RepID=A0A077B0R6_9PROT|nr:glutamate--tRNA ligase [Candidatus Paracaedibacter acanthamoebae]AIK96515.1 glutamyl-tRNA synthetase [Candidatus Paracaedibacter acanthamoebae]